MKLIIAFLLSLNAYAEHSAITHAPIGVMGDHIHGKGEFMISTRAMFMKMEGMRRGSDDINPSDYSQNVKPLEMDMKMYMLGGMYGLTDSLTLMGMINYISNNMDLRNQMMGRDFETSSSSLGDSKVGLLYKIGEGDNHHGGTIFKFSIGVPTGSVKEKDSVPMMGVTRLPYPMQTGSGSWGSFFGFTHQGFFGEAHLFNWGVESEYLLRLGNNGEDYRFGDEFHINTWLAYEIKSWVSVSLRANWKWRDDIEGSDSGLNITPAMNPGADPSSWGGNWTSIFTGANFYLPKGHRLALELGFPASQNVHGLQMSQDWMMVLGWQYLF